LDESPIVRTFRDGVVDDARSLTTPPDRCTLLLVPAMSPDGRYTFRFTQRKTADAIAFWS
jgi:hypothetical protein